MSDTPQFRERHVSKKLWIREILEGTFKAAEGSEPNVLVTSRDQASKVNIIGVIINKEELPVASVLIDDGSGQIRIRSFDKPITQTIGSVVQVIGRPRSYQGEIYIAAETTQAIAPGWAEFRKQELGDVRAAAPKREEQVIIENNAEKILHVIKQLDTGEGADIDEVILHSKIVNAEAIINQLLLHGDIFELRPGRIKIL